MQIHVFKARKTLRDKPVENMLISATNEIPETNASQNLDSIFESDASALFSAISQSLPGGTIDQLLVLLLTAKASHFRIPSYNEKTR